ncbi:unnamed protein product, partial [Mesorhabditis spiculigera]
MAKVKTRRHLREKSNSSDDEQSPRRRRKETRPKTGKRSNKTVVLTPELDKLLEPRPQPVSVSQQTQQEKMERMIKLTIEQAEGLLDQESQSQRPPTQQNSLQSNDSQAFEWDPATLQGDLRQKFTKLFLDTQRKPGN